MCHYITNACKMLSTAWVKAQFLSVYYVTICGPEIGLKYRNTWQKPYIMPGSAEPEAYISSQYTQITITIIILLEVSLNLIMIYICINEHLYSAIQRISFHMPV